MFVLMKSAELPVQFHASRYRWQKSLLGFKIWYILDLEFEERGC